MSAHARQRTGPRAIALAPALLSALALALTGCGAGQARTPSLRFTAIPDHNTTELQEKFEPLAEYLSATLGVTAEYLPTADYQASVEAFKNGDVLLAWFGGLTGVQARAAVDGAQAIAQGVVDPEYKSYFIAHESAGLERSEQFPLELAGKSFTFGSKSSTSGRLMPEHFIRLHTGKSPAEFFGMQEQFSGSHDRTAQLVASGAFEAGAINYKTYDKMVASGAIDAQVCRIVWVTPGYADYNWTAHPGLEEQFGAGFTERLQRALVELEDVELLRAVDREEGLIPAQNADFASVHELAEELGFLRD